MRLSSQQGTVFSSTAGGMTKSLQWQVCVCLCVCACVYMNFNMVENMFLFPITDPGHCTPQTLDIRPQTFSSEPN